jgi:hypothetical protein
VNKRIDKDAVTVQHYTPPWLLEPIERYAREIGFEGIELDPATSNDNWTNAKRFFTGADAENNGLMLPWTGEWGEEAFVFCNPPYGRELRAWVEKIAHEAAVGHATIVTLLPGQRFEQRYWQQCLMNAETLCCRVAITGRVDFYARSCKKCLELESAHNHKDKGCAFEWSGLYAEGLGNPFGSFLYLLGLGHNSNAARRIFREVGHVEKLEWSEPFNPPAGSRRFKKGLARPVKK